MLTDIFHTIRYNANIHTDFTIHGFRRYCINTLRRNNVDIVTIQKIIGHKDIRTTEIYCEVVDEEVVEAIEKIKIEF